MKNSNLDVELNELIQLEIRQNNAKYIYSILKTQFDIVMSWGAKNFYSCVFNNMNALRFNVNGFIHKGYLYICYNNGLDLFEVFATDDKNNILHESKRVYIDMLVEIIDGMVETKNDQSEQYASKVDVFIKNMF